jgi:hypothetical protein
MLPTAQQPLWYEAENGANATDSGVRWSTSAQQTMKKVAIPKQHHQRGTEKHKAMQNEHALLVCLI